VAGGRHREPEYWKNDEFNHSQQPVVGVCWNEARAYCAWLSAQTGGSYRLPTEAEWESAARGKEGRRFVYGNEFDASCGNTLETHIRRTTSVGVFPAGHTTEGLMDMTGNVWEWTSSLYLPYPYRAADGRENPISESGRRVLRGGSWGSGQDGARAASRFDGPPNFRDFSIGFRVVRSSHIVCPLPWLSAAVGGGTDASVLAMNHGPSHASGIGRRPRLPARGGGSEDGAGESRPHG
jgi:formylglycine-generating enzyme required for sulfatase activity